MSVQGAKIDSNETRAKAAVTSDQKGAAVTNDNSGQSPDQPQHRATQDYRDGNADVFENRGIEWLLSPSQPVIYQPDSDNGGMPPAEPAPAAPAPPTSQAPPSNTDGGPSGPPETPAS